MKTTQTKATQMKKTINPNMTNRKMNDATYKLRRAVIAIVYDARNMIGRDKFPRIDVRIADNKKGHENVAGSARLNANVIWIRPDYANNSPYLRELVLHELVHAVTGFGHDAKCPLMAPQLGDKPLTKANADKAFKKYFK